MVSFKITNITYDTYDEEAEKHQTQEDLGLPTEMVVQIDLQGDEEEWEIYDLLTYQIENQGYGWLVESFDFDTESKSAEEGKTRTFVVSSVDYETDGEELDLPQDFTFTLDEYDTKYLDGSTDMQEIADLLVDSISDETGWLVQGFYFQEKMPDGTLVGLDAEAHDSKPVGHYDWFRIFVQSDALGDEWSGWYDGTDFETASRDFDEYAHGFDKVQLVGYYLDDDEEQEEDVIRLFVSGNTYDADSYQEICPHCSIELESVELHESFICPSCDEEIMNYRVSSVPAYEMGAEGLEFTDWANQETKHHGKTSLKEWADHEIKKHGGKMSFQDWAKHEDKSHIDRFGLEYHDDAYDYGDSDIPWWAEEYSEIVHAAHCIDGATETKMGHLVWTLASQSKYDYGLKGRYAAEDCEYCGTKEEEELTEIREDSWDGPKVLVCDRCLDIAMYGAEDKTDLMYSYLLNANFPTRKQGNAWVKEMQPAFKHPLKVRKRDGKYYIMYSLPYDKVMDGSLWDAENWGGDPTGKLATALRKARIKAKEPKKPLKIEKLDAETSGQWEIGEQLEEAQMNAEGWDYMREFNEISQKGFQKKGFQNYHTMREFVERMDGEISRQEEQLEKAWTNEDENWNLYRGCMKDMREANAAMKAVAEKLAAMGLIEFHPNYEEMTEDGEWDEAMKGYQSEDTWWPSNNYEGTISVGMPCGYCDKPMSDEWWDDLQDEEIEDAWWDVQEVKRGYYKRTCYARCPHCKEELEIVDDEFNYGESLIAENYEAEEEYYDPDGEYDHYDEGEPACEPCWTWGDYDAGMFPAAYHTCVECEVGLCDGCYDSKTEMCWECVNEKATVKEAPKGIDTFTEPFEESSLDSGTVKSIAIGMGLGLLGCFGYSKWK